MTRVAVLRIAAWPLLALLLPACSMGGGGGTLTPTVAPGIPIGVAARAGNRSATIDWLPSAQGSEYSVLRSIVPQGPFFPISVPSQFPLPTRYIDPDLTNGTTYYYQVVAQNSFGQSAPSAVVSATPAFVAAAVAAGPGSGDMLALLGDGTVWEWGLTSTGSTLDVPNQVPGLADITAISSGANHDLALASDGRIWAWGNDSFGQIGDGLPPGPIAQVPVQVVTLTDAVAVASGGQHSLALAHDGRVWAWGDNSHGQFGLGTTLPASSSTPQLVPGLSGIVAIAAGSVHNLALRDDGLLFSWGQNPNGQLGNGSSDATAAVYAPAMIGGLNGVVAIAAGVNHSLALREDGTVWAWGSNGTGQLGLGTASATPVTIAAPTLASAGVIFTGVVAIAAGGGHSLAVKSDGSVWAWGTDASGQVGNGTVSATPVTYPVPVKGITNAVLGACSSWNGIALGQDGTVWTWGDNTQGELGTGTGLVVVVPEQLSNVTGVLSAAGGNGFSLAARAPGTVYGWGSDASAQLGNGATSATPIAAPVQTGTLSNAIAVSAGNLHGLALLSTGVVMAWGDNTDGQLGLGSTSGTPTKLPAQTLVLNNIVAISCGQFHNLAIRQDPGTQARTLWAWGFSSWGQMGTGTSPTTTATPVQVPGLSGVVSAAGGDRHCIAVLSDGTVWTWGANEVGQLGLGTTNNTPNPTPTQVPGITNAIAAGAGLLHSLVVLGDGTVLAWGRGLEGQLGNGLSTSSSSPVPVTDLSGVVSVTGGTGHSLALKSDGTVWSWGDNSHGQLGNIVLGKSAAPVPVQGLSSVSSISAGSTHSLALLQNQTLWLWGWDSTDQLGVPPVQLSATAVVVTH